MVSITTVVAPASERQHPAKRLAGFVHGAGSTDLAVDEQTQRRSVIRHGQVVPAFGLQCSSSPVCIGGADRHTVLPAPTDVQYGPWHSAAAQNDPAVPIHPFVAVDAQEPRLKLRCAEVGRQVDPAGECELGR